ncbi:MAG: DUF2238 domain-containing protein [Alphaproteobacteria bacterium]|nr:DUF2238 domain-containing protein [Alphaproteobacteria bacterium]
MKKTLNLYFPLFLSVILCVLTFISYSNAYDTQVWWTEIASVFFLLLIFGLTYKKFKFSNTAYFILFAWCVLQVIGAQYTFERVPFDYITNLFGFERNHYDRVAHFTIGCSSFLISEFVYRKGFVSGKIIAICFGIIFIMAMANAWELVEWIYAEVDGGSAGQAFLGSQGDIWDAQKDMLMDTLGALLGGIIFYFFTPKKSHSLR